MKASDAYARLLELGLPTVETSDVAAALRVTTGAATMLLTRLADSGLVKRLRPGVWLVRGDEPDRYALGDALTSPFPSYVSLHTALYVHGCIEQVPSVIYLVSLGRTHRLKTSVGVYSVHQIAPELFGGYERREDGSKLATPEKALFDMAYLSGSRIRLFSHLPELALPRGFRAGKLRAWTSRVSATRRRSMVETRLDRMLDKASAASSGSASR